MKSINDYLKSELSEISNNDGLKKHIQSLDTEKAVNQVLLISNSIVDQLVNKGLIQDTNTIEFDEIDNLTLELVKKILLDDYKYLQNAKSYITLIGQNNIYKTKLIEN